MPLSTSVYTEKDRQMNKKHGNRHVFYRYGPRIVIAQGGNLGRFSPKFHYLGSKNVLFIGISGVWGAKKAPHVCRSSPHRPTPARREPPLEKRNMYGLFTNVATASVIFARSRKWLGRIRGRGHQGDTESPGLAGRGEAEIAMSSNNKTIQQPIVRGQSCAFLPRCADAAVDEDASIRWHSGRAGAG